jgi:hypothetical protein
MKKIILSLVLSLSMSSSALACTLFGATGIGVEGNGTIAVKNRDWKPSYQKVELVTPGEGYRYFALLTGKKGGFDAGGINEKGLFVAMSTVSSISRAERNSYPKFRTAEGKRANDYMLAHYATVLEVVESKENIWSEPVNFIIGDKDSLAIIEVLPGGKRSVTYQENGNVFHTNHYVDKDTIQGNKKIGKSSLTRYNRIRTLLNEHIGKFTVNDFWRMSKDQNAGPNNSIFRVGSKPQGTRTVAELVATLPQDGNFRLEIRYQPTPDATQWQSKTITPKDFQK